MQKNSESSDKKNTSLDLRVVKTIDAIHNAFWNLLSKKDVTLITIKDIAETAKINRKTFYRYYDGLYKLLDEIEDSIILDFENAIESIEFNKGLKNPSEIFEKLIFIIEKNNNFYSYLLKQNNNINFIAKISSSLGRKIEEALSKQTSMESWKIKTISQYIVAGMLAVYQNWFNNKQDVPLKNLTEEVSVITYNALSGIINK